MKILVISDVEAPALWDYFHPGRLDGIDLILSCGDLDPRYLSFLATFSHGPVLYVHGNHDKIYQTVPPEGCICIEDKVFCFRGLKIAGLGGSMRYKPGPHQYTQAQMSFRAARLWPGIYAGRKKKLDILITHAPAYGLGDSPSLAHTGFKAFRRMMDSQSLRYLVHGHVHLNYDPLASRIQQYKETTIINAYERYILEIPEP